MTKKKDRGVTRLEDEMVEDVFAMSDAEIDRFVQFYERLTRFMLTEMQSRADAVIHLGANREPLELDIHIR